jgi:Zn-dependent protease with chaperone function
MRSAIFFAVLNAASSALAMLAFGLSPTIAGIVAACYAAATLIAFIWANRSGERSADRFMARLNAEYRAERIIRAARRGSYGY